MDATTNQARKMEQYLTVAEVAAELDVCTPTVRKMITEGTLAAYRLTPAGHWRIRVSEFNRVAHDLESGQATDPATASTSDLETLLS